MQCPWCLSSEVYNEDRRITADDLGVFIYRCHDCGCRFVIEEVRTILEGGKVEA